MPRNSSFAITSSAGSGPRAGEGSRRMYSGLVGANVVVTANFFNPSVFSQIWLAKNQIVEEDAFEAGCLFSEQVVNVQARQFALLIVPPQLQFMPKVPADQQELLLVERLGAIVRTLPHTPYSGVGLNFTWHIEPKDGDIRGLTRALFYRPEKPIDRFFVAPDSQFGAYYSKDTLGCRMKLDIKPVLFQSPERVTNILQLAFNFHLEIPKSANGVAEAIIEHLAGWNRAFEVAKEITEATQAV